MKIIFLPSAEKDLEWFVKYYETVFPEGHKRATKSFDAIIELLQEFPEIGKKVPSSEYRKGIIARTPFVFLYKIQSQHIEIIRVKDTRGKR